MDAGEGAWLQRLATDSTALAQVDVQVVDVGRGQISDRSGTEVRVEIAVQHRSGLANCGRRPACLCDCEPPFEQLPHRCSRGDAGPSADSVDHEGELAFGLGPVAAHRL